MNECMFLADSTNGRAYATVLRLSVCLSVTLCIVAKRRVLDEKLLLDNSYKTRYWIYRESNYLTLTWP